MWLSDKLKDEDKNMLTAHTVLQGGVKPVLSGKGKLSCLMPYGVYSALPSGVRAYSIDDLASGVALIPENIPELEAGEVCLYSKGGYILIKNSGEIIINGKTLDV